MTAMAIGLSHIHRPTIARKGIWRRRFRTPPLRSTTPTHRSISNTALRLRHRLPVHRQAEESAEPTSALQLKCIQSTSLADVQRPPASNTTRAPSFFNFAALPLEIRRMVYEDALTSAVSLEFKPPESDVHYRFIAHIDSDFPSFSVAILLLSKAVYLEASQILYGKNMFHFHIGTRSQWGNSLFESGPSPYNTSLALSSNVLSRLCRVKVILVTERMTRAPANRDGIQAYRRLASWIAQLGAWLCKARPGTLPLREVELSCHMCHSSWFSMQLLNALNDGGQSASLSVIENSEDSRILDGLLCLRGVGDVQFSGDIPVSYQETFRNRVMRPYETRLDVAGMAVGKYVLRSRSMRGVAWSM